MREIKFRAWDKNGDGMFYNVQDGILFDDGSIYEFRYFFDQREGDIHDWELMQYTGLLDKQGKNIYEGDICEMIILGDRSDYLKYNKNIDGALVVVEIRNLIPGFISVFLEMQHPDDKDWKSFWQCEDNEWWNKEYFTIIGNIYENPELLKETP
jgi:uncharacterized phage protein (TIGR01671 family)